MENMTKLDSAHLADHRKYLVCWRVDGQYNNPPPGSPLSQVLHQEEGVEDVHAVRGLVEDDDVSVQLEMAGHVESPLL